jgi:probable phosphoglycerate mutase
MENGYLSLRDYFYQVTVCFGYHILMSITENHMRIMKYVYKLDEMEYNSFILNIKGETMNHFYFIRHGETVWNVENKICGATDIELTENGHQQAIETGKKILEMGIKADMILTSPLVRAAETARHISEITGIPMKVEPRLIEQNFGRYESTPRDGAEFHEAKKDMASRFGSGESMLQLAQRIYNLLDDVKASDKEYILVAHNGIARIVESYFREMDNEDFSSFGIKNCEVKKYEF